MFFFLEINFFSLKRIKIIFIDSVFVPPSASLRNSHRIIKL